METPIGKVTHYYDRAGVAVVALSSPLKVGDHIKIKDHDQEWEQEITSMQVDRQPVSEGSTGTEVAIKVDQGVREGALLIKI